MPVNPGYEYLLAEWEYNKAQTLQEKLRAAEKMMATVPKHKSSENLVQNIQQRITRLKTQLEKEKAQAKGKGKQIAVKKEGAAQIAIVGVTNSGKSSFLAKITNAKPIISGYEFTTGKPEVGILDYEGLKLQLVEIPAITENFMARSKGPAHMGIIRNADLVILLLRENPEKEFNLLIKELDRGSVKLNSAKFKSDVVIFTNGIIIINGDKKFKANNFDLINFNVKKENDVNKIRNLIWKNLNIIHVFTKTPGKKKEFPPISLKKGSKVLDLAENVHKDFVKRFRFARIWGKSAIHQAQQVGLNHLLQDGDVVELHLK